jgi:ribosome-associated protein
MYNNIIASQNYTNYTRSQVEQKRIVMKITTEYIKLDSFLKAVNAAASGGEAKILIAEGFVSVNGEVELRRGRKLRPGDFVELEGRSYTVEQG